MRPNIWSVGNEPPACATTTEKPMTRKQNDTTPDIHVSIFKGGLYDTTPQEGRVSWPKLYKHLTTIRKAPGKKHETPAISFAEYGPNKTRANANVLRVHALCYDIDNQRRVKDDVTGKTKLVPVETPISPGDLDEYLPFAHAYYSTYSHRADEAPRWRLVIPLEHPIPAEDYPALYTATAEALGLQDYYDPSCINPSRLFYDAYSLYPAEAFAGGEPDRPLLSIGAKATESEVPDPAEPKAQSDLDNLIGLANYVPESQQRSPEGVWNLLKFIDPDAGEAIWKRVILALQHHFVGSDRSDIGLEIAHNWSLQSSNYDGREINQMWRRPVPANAASLGSLVHLAKQNGYNPPPSVDWGAYRFEAIGPLYLAQNLPEPNWLVTDLINRDALTMLSGQGGIGKSMLLMQLSVALASGTPFMGYPVPGPHRVFYLNAEDSTMKFARRLTAYRDISQTPAEPLIHNLHYYGAERTFQRLTTSKGINKKALEDLTHSITAAQQSDPSLPSIVIFDPFIQFIQGSENDNSEMNNGIVAFRQLQTATRSTILFGHHEAKRPAGAPVSGGNGHSGRGASAIYDGARQAFKLRWQDDEEIESIIGIQAADLPRDEKTRFIALEHTKADEGEIRGDLLLRRGIGGTLSVAHKLTIEERREMAECFMLEQDWKPGEEEARDAFLDRYIGLLVRGMAPTQTDLKRSAEIRERYMGTSWTRDTVEKWLNFGVMEGRLRRLPRGQIEAVGQEGSSVWSIEMADILS